MQAPRSGTRAHLKTVYKKIKYKAYTACVWDQKAWFCTLADKAGPRKAL